MVNLLSINMKSKVVFLFLCIGMIILSSCKNDEEKSIAMVHYFTSPLIYKLVL